MLSLCTLFSPASLSLSRVTTTKTARTHFFCHPPASSLAEWHKPQRVITSPLCVLGLRSALSILSFLWLDHIILESTTRNYCAGATSERSELRPEFQFSPCLVNSKIMFWLILGSHNRCDLESHGGTGSPGKVWFLRCRFGENSRQVASTHQLTEIWVDWGTQLGRIRPHWWGTVNTPSCLDQTSKVSDNVTTVTWWLRWRVWGVIHF